MNEEPSRRLWFVGQVELELKCCCCGRVLDTLVTPWSVDDLQPQSLWSREPCQPCKLDLATEALLRS